MKEKFYGLPAPLQKQIAIRIAGGAVFLLLFVSILLGFRDFYFSLPCLLLSGFLLINGIRLWNLGSTGGKRSENSYSAKNEGALYWRYCYYILIRQNPSI